MVDDGAVELPKQIRQRNDVSMPQLSALDAIICDAAFSGSLNM